MTDREITVRQLGGEIWAEIDGRMENGVVPFDHLTTEVLDAVMNIVIGVLARYEEAIIINDKDLPVEALPTTTLTD